MNVGATGESRRPVRKSAILLCFLVVLAGESGWYGTRLAASVLHLRGERAFFRNDLVGSLKDYDRALELGGERDLILADRVQLLLFAMDQQEAGVKVKMPLPAEQTTQVVHHDLRVLIGTAPSKAFYWSLAADAYRHDAYRARRATPIDIATLSENPLANLTPQDWLAIGAMEVAARLEPNAYIYQDMLVEHFLEMGVPSRAADHCRLAVLALPDLDEHQYLSRPNLDAAVYEAAVQGFTQSLEQGSMIPAARIDCDVARLMLSHGDTDRALDYLNHAIARQPGWSVPRYLKGTAYFRTKQYEKSARELAHVVQLKPTDAASRYYLGLAYEQMGRREDAISELTKARELRPEELKYFHALGAALEATGRLQEAERQYLAAANLHPRDTGAWARLIEFYKRHGEVREAQRACSRAQSSDHVDALGSACDALSGDD